MSSRRLPQLLLCVLLSLPLAASPVDRSFKEIVGRLEAHYQKRPMRGMGFLGFLANCFSPAGISHLKLAIFEDVDVIKKPLDSDFESFLKHSVGDSYQPFVTVRSNRSGERVFLFAKDLGERVELLMVCADKGETVVMKVRIKPEALAEWSENPTRMARASR